VYSAKNGAGTIISSPGERIDLKTVFKAPAAPTDITVWPKFRVTPCSPETFFAIASRVSTKPGFGIYPWRPLSSERAISLIVSKIFFGGSRSGFPILKS